MSLMFLACFVGFFSAAIGVGGGSIMVPALTSIFKYDFRRAASISLATIIPISFIGVITHLIFQKQTMHLLYLYYFVPSCIMGSILGSFCIKKFKILYLKIAFAIFIITAAVKMLDIYNFTFVFFNIVNKLFLFGHFISILLFGLLTGFISIILGVGCGLIIVPFFVVIINLTMHEAIILSLVTMFFLSSSASILHKKNKLLDVKSAKSMFLPALIGSISGAICSNCLSNPMLKKMFGAFLLIMGFKFIIEECHYLLTKDLWKPQNNEQ